MHSLFYALGLFALLALGFAGVRAYFAQRAVSSALDFFASISGSKKKSAAAQREAASTERLHAALNQRFAALVQDQASLRAWLQLREDDRDNFLTDRIDATLRARADLEADLRHLLESPLRRDRGLGMRHVGLTGTTSDRTANAALEAVELLTTELRDDRALRTVRAELLQPLLFGAAQACDTLRERGHFVETAARNLRIAVAALGRNQELDYVVATLDHALAP